MQNEIPAKFGVQPGYSFAISGLALTQNITPLAVQRAAREIQNEPENVIVETPLTSKRFPSYTRGE